MREPDIGTVPKNQPQVEAVTAAHQMTEIQALPRARGDVRLTSGRRGPKTVLRDFYQSGSMKCLYPRSAAAPMTAVLLNTAGGMTGGDRFSVQAQAQPGAHLVLTTQAAERVYRSPDGGLAALATTLTVEDGARIDWLPQETILFDGASLGRRLRIDLCGSAQALMVEPLVFGRAAMPERLNQVTLRDRIDLFRDGELIFADRTRLDGDAHADLARKAVADGAGAAALVLLAAPGAALKLDGARDLLPDGSGVCVLGDDLLAARLLATDSYLLRRQLVPLLAHLGADPLPRTWML